jgi:hypothetical protein
MTITHQIDRLAKKYKIDYSLFRNEAQKLTVESDEVQRMSINILLDIQDEFSSNTTIDGFYFYAKKHIEDKTRIPELTYSLLLLTESSIDQVKALIADNKSEYKKSIGIKNNDGKLDLLDSSITKQEHYLYRLTETLAFFRMEIDLLKSNRSMSSKDKTKNPKKAYVGLNWVGSKRMDLVNELFQSLKGQFLDPKTRYKDFERLFIELSLDESLQSINWIHQGGAFSLRYMFYLLTQEPPLFSCTKINKALSLAFTINGKKINPNTLGTYNSKMKDGILPPYYTDLEQRINKILASSK